MSTGGVEASLPLVPLSNADQVIDITKVKLGEDLGLLKLVEYRGHEWEWISILDCDVVQWAVVDARMQRSVLLSHEEETGSRR